MLGNMSVRGQLAMLLATMFLLFLGAMGVAIQGLNQTRARFETFVDRDQGLLLAYGEMYAQGLQMGQALRNILIDPENPKAYDNLGKAEGDFATALGRARSLGDGGPLEKVQALRQRQHGVQVSLVELVKSGQTDAARKLLNQSETPLWREMKQLLLDEMSVLEAQAGETRRKVQGEAERARNLSLAASALAVVLGLVMAFFIASHLVRAINRFRSSMEELAGGKGDLTRRMAVSGRNELGETARAFNAFMDGLQAIEGTVKTTAVAVDEAARQLASLARTVAQEIRDQSETASSSAAAVEEMTVSIGQVAENAELTRARAEEAVGLAASGRQALAEATNEMNHLAASVAESAVSIRQLQEHSDRIGGIAGLIREIADQTNLLALNAAIEAARAGEAGRGFAVVADEVRKLAERTTAATGEIQSMVMAVAAETAAAAEAMQQGSQRVERGVGSVQRLTEPLVRLTEGAEATLQHLVGLADATREQDASSTLLAQNVERIAQMADASRAAMEQAVAASAGLEQLAEGLKQAMGAIKV